MRERRRGEAHRGQKDGDERRAGGREGGKEEGRGGEDGGGEELASGQGGKGKGMSSCAEPNQSASHHPKRSPDTLGLKG